MTVMRVGLEIDLPDPDGTDDGGVPVATDDGGLVYLRGTESGQTLVWDDSLGTWAVSDDLSDVRGLLEEMVFYLATLNQLPPTTKLRELCDVLEAKGIV